MENSTVIAGILFFFSVLGLIIFLSNIYKRIAYTGRVRAWFVGTQEHRDESYTDAGNGTQRRQVTVTNLPIFEYEVNGVAYRQVYRLFHAWQNFKPGTPVELCYLPKNPNRIMPKGEVSTLIMGLLLVVLPLALLWFFSSQGLI